MYYVYMSDSCVRLHPQFYICDQMILQESRTENLCEIQILGMKNTSTCQQVAIHVTKPMFKLLDESNQWIGLLPSKEKSNYIAKSKWTLRSLPEPSCSKFLWANNKSAKLTTSNLSLPLRLDEKQLDELQEIRTEIFHNQPHLSYESIAHVPSVWTVIIYGVILLAILCYIYTTLMLKRTKTPPINLGKELTEVQAPR